VLLRAALWPAAFSPMAESADDPTLFWVEPEMRGVISRSTASASRRALARHGAFRQLHRHRQHRFQSSDIRLCRATSLAATTTWINKGASAISTSGCMKSDIATASRSGRRTEPCRRAVRRQPRPRLLRREHVFTRARDASKVALVHLVARLDRGAAFGLLDTQYVTEHLRSLGAVEDIAAALLYAARQGDRGRG